MHRVLVLVLVLIVTMSAIGMKTATGSIATGIAKLVGVTPTTTTSIVARGQL